MTNPTTRAPHSAESPLPNPGLGFVRSKHGFASRETIILGRWVALQAARYDALLATIAAAPVPIAAPSGGPNQNRLN